MSQLDDTREMSSPRVIVGLFRDSHSAERAIRALHDAGFSRSSIGVAARDRQQQTELIEDTGTSAAEGAAAGAVSGGVLGGLVGLLAGAGALAIPGIGPLVAGGTLASTLAGAGLGAAAGGLVGALVGMGIPEHEAEHFERGVREGGVLVTVDARGRGSEARRILEATGADLGRGSMIPVGTGEMERTTRSLDRDELDADLAGDERAILEEETIVGYVRGGDVLMPIQESDEAETLESEPWRGNERRFRQDPSYAGPERRVGVA